MSKYNGVAKSKQEKRHQTHRSDLETLVSGIAGKVDKFANDWATKHNGVAKQVQELAKQVAQDIGQLSAYVQVQADSIDRLDLNLLALAELNKRLCLQVMQSRAPADTPKEDIEREAQEFYKKELAGSFDVALKRRKEAEEAAAAARQKAAEERKAAAEAKSEAERAEKVLLDAERGLINEATGGGQGVPIPEGAEVFGG
jgi:hypothetical protein